jgi:hypothetical protein
VLPSAHHKSNKRSILTPSQSSDVRFNNLHQFKRGSEDYSARKAAHADMHRPTGFFGSLFNSTFKGYDDSKK